MDKIRLKDLNLESKIHDSEKTKIFLINDNEIFKQFDSGYLIDLLDNNYDIEDKILNASELVYTPEILIPNSAVYKNGKFVGYTSRYIDGVSIYEFAEYNKDISSIEDYTNFFNALEYIIEDSENIVFPDLLSDGNIMLNPNELALIDFDGIQIDNYPTPTISSSLGKRKIYKE